MGKLAVGARAQRDRDSLPVGGARLSVATLLRRELEGRIRGVFRGYAIVSVGLARDLFTVVRANTPAIVVTEPWDTVGDPVAPIIHRLKVALPSIAIIAYCEPNTAAQREALPLARAGVDAIVLRGIDDEPCVFRASIEQAHHRSLEAEALAAISPVVPPDVAAFVAYCLRHAGQGISVERAATGLGIDRKTLLNRLAKRHLPSPREIAAWCRLLVAARLLEDPGRSAEHVGLSIGCGSGTALRNLFLRHTGLRPAAVRAHGATQTVLAMFVARLRARRE